MAATDPRRGQHFARPPGTSLGMLHGHTMRRIPAVSDIERRRVYASSGRGGVPQVISRHFRELRWRGCVVNSTLDIATQVESCPANIVHLGRVY